MMIEASRFAHTLIFLLAAHSLADFPLQGDFLSKGKNFKTTPFGAWMPWYCCMAAHALIHAGFVQLITGSFVLGFCEFILHFLIDCTKCYGAIDATEDQALHVACKLVWAIACIFACKRL
jgi:hypothetical protein